MFTKLLFTVGMLIGGFYIEEPEPPIIIEKEVIVEGVMIMIPDGAGGCYITFDLGR